MSASKRLLSIDTSGGLCSAALMANGHVISRSFADARQSARRLPAAVAELCAAQKVSVGALDGLVYATGPGSFTGLRIGIALVQGFALAGGLPVAGVSSLRAIAQAVFHRETAWTKVRVVNNAHMGEVFVGLYERCDALAHLLSPDALRQPAAVGEEPVDGLVGDGLELCPRLAGSDTPRRVEPVATAEALIEIAQRDEGIVWTTAEHAKASYLRADDALVQQKPTRSP